MNLLVHGRIIGISSCTLFKNRSFEIVRRQYAVAVGLSRPFHHSPCSSLAAAEGGMGKGRKGGSAVTDKVGPEKSYLDDMLTERAAEPKTTGQKVKRAAATTFYIGFGIVSFAMLGFLTFYIFKEFFAFSTPQGLYRDAVKLIKNDDRCQELFGHRMLTFGEESGRGRRRHIVNYKYVKDGRERIRIMFHVKGDKQMGRVHAEIEKEVSSGWDYRYLLVESEGHPRQSIVIIDNR